MTDNKLEYIAKDIDPSAVVLIKEDSYLMRMIDVVVRPWNPNFMTDYATTVANRIYIPRQWFDDHDRGLQDLRPLVVHEATHVRQCRDCGFFHPIVGFPPFLFFYFLFIFPVGLAIGRVLLEANADAAAWKYLLEYGWRERDIMRRAEAFAECVASWNYFKPLPKKWVMKIFMRAAKRTIDNHKMRHG